MDYSNINIYLTLNGQEFTVNSLPFIMQGNTGVNKIVLFADFTPDSDGVYYTTGYVPKVSFYDCAGRLIKANVALNYKEGTQPCYEAFIPKAVTSEAGTVRVRFSLFIPVEVEGSAYDTDDLVDENGNAYDEENPPEIAYIVSNMNSFDFTVTPCGGGGGVRPSF